MSKLAVFTILTLDGVMQAPARPDEDTHGGFTHGGWAIPYADAVTGSMAGQPMTSPGGGILLGRRTYEDFFEVWPKRKDNPFTDALNNRQKYVASRTLKEPLPWVNSTLLKGDAAAAVANLKKRDDMNLVVLGSGDLVQTLMRANLVDEYVLLIHPVVLGSGNRLFADGGSPQNLRLVDSKVSTTGVVVGTYRPS